MDSKNIRQIKKDLKRTKKAIVALGCSFVEGTELSKNPRVQNSLSFVNVLCNRYLDNNYTPINFGQEACGNAAAINKLFLYDIPWHNLNEIKIIFCPTAMFRYDIIDDSAKDLTNNFKTLYPEPGFQRTPNDQRWWNMNVSYTETCWSKKFDVLNFILEFQILNTWAQLHNADLLVFPAFNNEFTRKYFKDCLNLKISRDVHTQLKNKEFFRSFPNYNYMLDFIPWDKFISIQNSYNFFDLCFKQDNSYDSTMSMYKMIDDNYFTKNNCKWIMERGHPSEIGHDLLAKELSKIYFSNLAKI
jgi:hypothetical protein